MGREFCGETDTLRIIYGIQSTGKGHLSRFLGLQPYFERDGHEVLVIASGYEDPPQYFLQPVRAAGYRYHRNNGISYLGDGKGGVSELGTARAFLAHFPRLMADLRRTQAIITQFAPDVIVNDFDPVSGSLFVAPGIPKVGLSHQNILLRGDMYHPPGLLVPKFFTFVVTQGFTSGLSHKLGCHFYPENEFCMPPIIRPAIREATVENKGHIIVYHTLPGLMEEIEQYAADHPDRRMIVYGYDGREDAGNMHFESDRARFPEDLAACDAYVGTAGFQSISETFYLGKKMAVHPTVGQYEQIWNAAQLEHHGMGAWYGAAPAPNTLEEALEKPFNHQAHADLLPWFRDGARICYERVMELAIRRR